MKKTIIILGLVLTAFTNVAEASTVSASILTTSKEIVNYNNSPLYNAIVRGDLAVLKKIVECGSDVDETSNGLAPLIFAGRYNKVDILKYLLEKGADKQINDRRINTALK